MTDQEIFYTVQTLHQELVELHIRASEWLEGGKPYGFCPEFGICLNLPRHCNDAFFEGLLATWPEGTGDQDYPVPHPVKKPWLACQDTNAEEMWNPKFEYARNRWALLDWLIEQTAPQFPYVVVRDPGTIHEEEIGTFATFLEAVAFADKNRDGHDVDVMKRQPDGSLTTEL